VALSTTFLAVLSLLYVPAVVRYRIPIGPSTAATLNHVATVIPANDEAIVALAVVGRFGERDSVYPFSGEDERFPVTRKRVVFVVTGRVEGGRPAVPVAAAAIRYIRFRLDAKVLEARSNVYAFAWSPPPGTSQVTLP
jgi:hypothetical protein